MIRTDGTPTIASPPSRVRPDVVLTLDLVDAKILQNLLWQVEDVSVREHTIRTYVDLQVAKGVREEAQEREA